MKRFLSVLLALTLVFGAFAVSTLTSSAATNLLRIDLDDATAKFKNGYDESIVTEDWWLSDDSHIKAAQFSLADAMKAGQVQFLDKSKVSGALTSVVMIKNQPNISLAFPAQIKAGNTYKISMRVRWDKSSKDTSAGTFAFTLGGPKVDGSGKEIANADNFNDNDVWKKTFVQDPEANQKSLTGWFLKNNFDNPGENSKDTWFKVEVSFTVPKDYPVNFIGVGFRTWVDSTVMYFDSLTLVDVNDTGAVTPKPTATVKPAPDIKVLYQGKEISFGATKPVIENGSTLVPLRAIFEALGATVDYANGNITAKKGDTVVKLTVGSKNATDRKSVV